jgi:ER-derived vesicles protein
MSQIRGTAGYHMGSQHPFGGPGTTEATNDPSPLDAIREQTSKIEDFLDTISDPLKPCVLIPISSPQPRPRAG